MRLHDAEYGIKLVSSLEIESACDCFENQLRNGGRPAIGDYELRVRDEQRPLLIRELLLLDAEWKTRRGEQVLLEQYVAEFPKIKTPLEAYVDFCASLYQITSPDRRTSIDFGLAPQCPPEESRSTGLLPQEPDRLFGRYVLLEVIGRGSTSNVFRAYDVTLRREVAIKMLRAEMSSDRQTVRRFLQEAQLLSGLQHPHVARVLEVGNPDRPYWVAELIDGPTLSQELERRGKFAPPEAVRLMASIAEAVDAVNRRGFVHRDLKPANLLMDSCGRPVLSDFGLAMRLDDDNRVSTDGWIGGSLPYMSPEQLSGETQGPWSEVFSLGAVLFELLTGKRAQSELEAIDVAAGPNAVELSQIMQNPKLPRDLQAICLKALASAKPDRYPDCGKLAEDLRRYLALRPVTAHSVSTFHKLSLWLQRNSVAVTIVALIFVSLGALLTLVVQRQMSTAQTLEFERKSMALRLHREAALGRFSRISNIERTIGWSDRAQASLNELIVSDKQFDPQPYQTICQTGLDARPGWTFPNCDASHVAWSPDGKRLAVSGGSHRPFLRTSKADIRDAFGVAAPGPVAWLNNSTCRQFIIADSRRALVYQSGLEQPIATLELTDDWKFRMEMPTRAPNCALSADTNWISAFVENSRGQFGVAWCSLTERTFNYRTIIDQPLCLAFSKCGNWLAIGTDRGRIEIWELESSELLAEWTIGRESIRSLDHFLADCDRAALTQRGLLKGLGGNLAVGDDGGTVRLLELPKGEIKLVLRGGLHQILSLDFNGDGTLLASAGRTEIRIFDAANGELALRVNTLNGHSFDHVVGLDFSPEGKQLAFASVGVFAPALAASLDLSFDRGIRTLRGLDSQTWQLEFSSSGKWLAALDQRWNLAVWDVAGCRLLSRYYPAHGFSVDNAAIHLDEQKELLTFSAGSSAIQWNLPQGQIANTWDLPDGLQDTLLELPDQKLILIRYERSSGVGVPKPKRLDDSDERLIVVRELLPDHQFRELCRVRDFSQRIESIQSPARGRVFVARGNSDATDPHPAIGMYEVTTGTRLEKDWGRRDPVRGAHVLLSMYTQDERTVRFEVIDPFDSLVGRQGKRTEVQGSQNFVFPSGTALVAISADANRIALRDDNDRDGLARFLEIWTTEPQQRILQIPVLGSVGLDQCEFDGSAQRVAWTNARGHVFWMDIRPTPPR